MCQLLDEECRRGTRFRVHHSVRCRGVGGPGCSYRIRAVRQPASRELSERREDLIVVLVTRPLSEEWAEIVTWEDPFFVSDLAVGSSLPDPIPGCRRPAIRSIVQLGARNSASNSSAGRTL